MELRQKFITYMAFASFLSASGIFTPILQFPLNVYFATGVLLLFLLFLNGRERFILKKNTDIFLALYFYIPKKHQKKVFLTLQFLATMAGLPFFALAMLLWFQHLLQPVELYKLQTAVGTLAAAGLYFTWYALYLVNNLPKVDRRILKKLKKSP